MHIAVLVYGRLNKCVEHYENIRNSLGQENTIDFFLSSDNSKQELLDDFIKLYNPILYTNELIHYDYDLGKYKKKEQTKYVFIPNMTSHFINKNRVIALLEEHIHKHDIYYDCVVSLRIDCVFRNTFHFTPLEENTIYIPESYDYDGINDMIAYGKLDVMKKYNYINAVYLLEKSLSIPHPESLTYANILFHKIKIKRCKVSYYLER